MEAVISLPGAEAATREPSVFISHKHADQKIANALREFLYGQSHRVITVFQSSSGESESPELGRSLAAELKTALWNTGLVILVYTTDDQDWQWCMWECGVATNPQSPDTRIITFQCSTETPRVFQDQVRVNVREKEDVLKFTRMLLTDPRFFPGYGRALAQKLSPDGPEVRKAADDLHAALGAVIPKTEVAEWSIQPVMRLQLPLDIVEKLQIEAPESTLQLADTAVVLSLDQQAKRIIGIAEVAPGTKLSGLGLRWIESLPGESLDWIRDIEKQLRQASRGDISSPGWVYVREKGGSGARYVPLLSRVRRVPAARAMQFDINLIAYDDLAATPVAAAMIQVRQMASHRLDELPLTALKVKDLAARLRRERLTRLPFIEAGNRLHMMVHRSMVDQYIAEKLTEESTLDLAALTFEEMLKDQTELRRLFENSFATVGVSARLRDVKAIMSANHEIQDVFITQTGSRDEPILGWVTNAMIAQHSP